MMSMGNTKDKDIGKQENSVTRPSIRINMKYSRITIHRNTLEVLDNPEYIRLGYCPGTKQMMIFTADSSEKDGIRLLFSKEGRCYVHSKAMLDGIRLVGGVLSTGESYLVYGVSLKDENAISFDLCRAIAENGDKYDA